MENKTVVGGQDGLLSTEVLTDSGWEATLTVLPVGLFVTCLVAIDDDKYFVHGSPSTPQTFIFTASINSWTQGPNLAIRRFGNGCGVLPKNEISSQLSIVIVGGLSG